MITRLISLFYILLIFYNPLLQAAEPESLAQTPLPDLLEAAEAGESAAQFELGNRFLYGENVNADSDQALHWYTKAGEQGNFNAQYNLGVMYLNGQGVKIDTQKAVNWFQLAADQGDYISQYSLGVLYANGNGIERDLALAYKWFSLAAATGDANAQANLVLFQPMLSAEQIQSGQEMAQQWIDEFKAEQSK